MARLIDGVVGHRDVWAKLDLAVERGHLPHAMSFTGPAGVGKKLVARALAQKLLCTATDRARPCGACGSCLRVGKNQSESVLSIEPEKNQIRIEVVRQMAEFLSLQRISAARVIVVDGAEKMNPQSANASLKLLEEPPPGTHFILVAPEASQLLPTLRSRSQNVRFGALGDEDLARAAGAGEPLEPWMLAAAAGSLERLAGFRDPEVASQRVAALDFLRDAVGGERTGLQRVLASVKDRERTLTIIRFLQRHLRDWTAGDLELAEGESFLRVELWRHAHRMELDFHAHVDRSLIFENFFNHARNGRIA